MSGGRLWGHVGSVEATWGSLETLPVACKENVVKSGRNVASKWNPLGSSLGLSAATVCGPGDQKEHPEVFERRFWLHRENNDILLFFQRFAAPSGGPNDDGVEALLGRT